MARSCGSPGADKSVCYVGVRLGWGAGGSHMTDTGGLNITTDITLDITRDITLNITPRYYPTYHTR